MRTMFVLVGFVVVGLAFAAGCGSSPPAPAPLDPKEFHRKMEEIGKEVMKQEGRIPPKPRP